LIGTKPEHLIAVAAIWIGATGSARPMGEHRRRFFGEHEHAAATKRSSGAAVFSKTASDR
jgi:hypothetical protein